MHAGVYRIRSANPVLATGGEAAPPLPLSRPHTSKTGTTARGPFGTVKSEKLYCEQAPGFNVKAKDGAPMVCEILVALQGRVDAARLFGDRLEQIIFKLGGTRSTWDPVHFLPSSPQFIFTTPHSSFFTTPHRL